MVILSYIREVLGRTTSADPHQIAKEVLAIIPPSDYADCLLDALPYEVKRESARLRDGLSRTNRTARAVLGERGKKPAIKMPDRFLFQLAPFDLKKFIKDLSGDDCAVISKNYQDLGKANAEKARRWALLAKEVPKGKTLADLPPGKAKAVILD